MDFDCFGSCLRQAADFYYDDSLRKTSDDKSLVLLCFWWEDSITDENT